MINSNESQTKHAISVFNNCYDTIAKEENFTFDELVQYFKEIYTKEFTSKKELGAIVYGIFSNKKRLAENIHSRSILSYDIDHYKHSLEQLTDYICEKLKGYSYIYYTTSSSSQVIPKLRLLLFPNKNIKAKDYLNVSENIAKAYLPELFDKNNYRTENKNATSCFDRTSYCTSQLMYVPCKINEDFKFGKNKNATINIERFINKDCAIKDANDFSTFNYKKLPVKLTNDEIESIFLKHDIQDMDYLTWVNMGMALHHHYNGADDGLLMWDKLSKIDVERYKGISDLRHRYGKFETSPKSITVRSFMQSNTVKQNNGEDIRQICLFDFPHVKINKQGEVSKVKSTYENFDFMCNHYGYKFAFDKIRKQITHTLNYTDMNSVATKVGSMMSLNEMDHKLAKNFISLQSSENIFNSFEDILKEQPWDGVSRLDDFFNTVTVEEKYKNIRNAFMLSYFKQFLHLALTTYDKRIIGKYTLFLKGEQGIGKTPWVERLLPERMREKYIMLGATLNVSKSMSVLATCQKLFVELGEIVKTTFKVTSEDEYKSHTGKKQDCLDIKYQPFVSEYDRTTSFIATLNEEYFLRDSTGSTRYLVLDCLDINGFHNIDMLQLYRELLAKYDCRNFQLSKTDAIFQAKYNEQFYYPSLLEEQFLDTFKIKNLDNAKAYNCTQVLEELGYRKSNIDQTKRLTIGGVLRKYGFKQVKRNKTYLLELNPIDTSDFQDEKQIDN